MRYQEVVLRLRGRLRGLGKVVIIPHWDCDGVASASLLMDYLRWVGAKVSVHIPKIGYYTAEALDVNEIKDKEPDTLLIVDYALSAKDLKEIKDKVGANIIVIDHHINKLPKKPSFLNPHIWGKDIRYYPSTTSVIKELLDIPANLRVALGIAGDLGHEALSHPTWGMVETLLTDRGISADELLALVKIIDSAYQSMSRELVMKSIYKLSKYGENFKSAINDSDWVNTYNEVKVELNELLKKAKPDKVEKNIMAFRFSSRYLLTSAVGRELARRYRDYVVVVGFEVFRGPSYVYVRSYSKDLSKVLEYLKGLGLNIGGKPSVFSIQVDDSIKLDNLLNYVIDALITHL
jgi:hypothetical protein